MNEIPSDFISLENNISEYEQTPLKKSNSLLKSFHESVIKNITKSPSKTKYGFSLEIELEGVIFTREFSTQEFASKALAEIEKIIAD